VHSFFTDKKTKFITGSVLSVCSVALALLATHNRVDNPQILGVVTPVTTREAPADNQPVISKVAQPKLLNPINTLDINAISFLVYDSASGTDLVGENVEIPLSIASVTKLLTAYTAYREIGLMNPIKITSKDQIDVSPVLWLKAGDEVLAQDLFNAMLVGSANDAAQTLANYTAEARGQKFIELMNKYAGELGMTDSHFSNPLGFDSDTNYSTVQDIKKLVQGIKQYQAFSLYSRSTGYKFTSELGNTYSIKATNKLVSGDKEINAIKTGFTEEAQGAMITEIIHDGHSFVIIVLGSEDREGDTLELKKQIIENYIWE
jgi:serine-type D-Ala-D-Ala carboxypeptidase (penicillin-binding protein 5/6)